MEAKLALILAWSTILIILCVPATGKEHTASYWNAIGTDLAEMGQYNDAIKCYDKAIRIDPAFAWPWNNKGNAFYNLGEYNKSIGAYDQSIEIDPQFAIAWYNKGKALHALHCHVEARAAFTMAEELGYAVSS